MPRTKAKIQVVTNTQLAVAVLAAFLAGGLAFAAAPAQNRVAAAPKCGVNSYSVLNFGKGCASGNYTGIDVGCYDGTQIQHRPGVCTPLAQLKNFATQACANRCSGAPVVRNGVLSLNIDNELPALRNPRYALLGTEKYLITRVRVEAQNESIRIEDLALRFFPTLNHVPGNRNTFPDDITRSIRSLSVYGNGNLNDASLLARTIMASTTVVIEDIDYRVDAGVPVYLYIAAEIDPEAPPAAAFQVSVADAGHEALGMASGNDIVPQVGNTVSAETMINGIKFVDVSSRFPGGRLVAGVQNLFSFQVTAVAGVTDEIIRARFMELDLRLRSDVATEESENISDLQLCRSDSGNCIPLRTVDPLTPQRTEVALTNLVNSTTTIFMMDAFRDSEDEFIDDGETVEFLVKGNVMNVNEHFIQMRIANLDNEGLKYGFIYEFDDLSPDHIFRDIRRDSPRPAEYPNVVGSALIN